ncbi:MAG: hypothetical protein OEX08_03140 [Candidatus Nomurabacteria bacterium]|nr:hypothetical protein [Candidatus Nomurabacteria bacterium]
MEKNITNKRFIESLERLYKQGKISVVPVEKVKAHFENLIEKLESSNFDSRLKQSSSWHAIENRIINA